MNRRHFLSISGSSTIGLSLFSSALFAHHNAIDMKAKDLNAYLRSLVEVNEPSVDKIIVGDPETVISKIGTAWMPYWNTLKEAKEVVNAVTTRLSPDAKIIWGAMIQRELGDSIRVLVIVTGVESPQIYSSDHTFKTEQKKEIEQRLGIDFI